MKTRGCSHIRSQTFSCLLFNNFISSEPVVMITIMISIGNDKYFRKPPFFIPFEMIPMNTISQHLIHTSPLSQSKLPFFISIKTLISPLLPPARNPHWRLRHQHPHRRVAGASSLDAQLGASKPVIRCRRGRVWIQLLLQRQQRRKLRLELFFVKCAQSLRIFRLAPWGLLSRKHCNRKQRNYVMETTASTATRAISERGFRHGEGFAKEYHGNDLLAPKGHCYFTKLPFGLTEGSSKIHVGGSLVKSPLATYFHLISCLQRG